MTRQDWLTVEEAMERIDEYDEWFPRPSGSHTQDVRSRNGNERERKRIFLSP